MNRARAEIRTGGLRKLVLARDTYRNSVLPIPVAGILEHLGATTPGCYLFAVTTPDGGTFLGASPERLFRLEGDTVETESLAGTRLRGTLRRRTPRSRRRCCARAKTRASRPSSPIFCPPP